MARKRRRISLHEQTLEFSSDEHLLSPDATTFIDGAPSARNRDAPWRSRGWRQANVAIAAKLAVGHRAGRGDRRRRLGRVRGRERRSAGICRRAPPAPRPSAARSVKRRSASMRCSRRRDLRFWKIDCRSAQRPRRASRGESRAAAPFRLSPCAAHADYGNEAGCNALLAFDRRFIGPRARVNRSPYARVAVE